MEYNWKKPQDSAVGYEGKLQLSQFDIKQTEFRGLNFSRGNNMGTYSVLQVVIALQRHTGYFLIQIYLPCTLLVVLSWVGFWLNREATSDRVGLGNKMNMKARYIWNTEISVSVAIHCYERLF